MRRLAHRVGNLGTTIFAEMTSLANEHGAVNLGQGFPDFAAPDFIKEAARQSIAAEINQYAPGSGQARLRRALARKMARHYGLEVDPDREITVTVGATEAIFAAIMGLVDPGDEVIVFEPYYDSYLPSLQFAGGTPRFYTLRPPRWAIDPDALEALFNERTRLVLLNTPHNPTGKVFSQEELALIARLCQQYDVIAVVDEVYEHIVFDGEAHASVIAHAGLRERAFVVFSFGKVFHATGWKTGYILAPRQLMALYRNVHQFNVFSVNHPLQHALAAYLAEPARYLGLPAWFQERRDRFANGLRGSRFKLLPCEGSYFQLVDYSAISDEPDRAFAERLAREHGVASIPLSPFYAEPPVDGRLLRFCFAKTDATLDAAIERLCAI